MSIHFTSCSSQSLLMTSFVSSTSVSPLGQDVQRCILLVGVMRLMCCRSCSYFSSKYSLSELFEESLPPTVIFLPARPTSQTHDSHKGRMILNHVNPAGRIKNCGEKSAFKNLQLSF